MWMRRFTEVDRIRVEQGLQPGQWGEGITLSISSDRGPKQMRERGNQTQAERKTDMSKERKKSLQ